MDTISNHLLDDKLSQKCYQFNIWYSKYAERLCLKFNKMDKYIKGCGEVNAYEIEKKK